MTPKQRMLAVMSGKIPDRVPSAPDFSNMVPARLTGKPFWDIYLYNDPPIWEAYIDAAKYFGIDAWLEGYDGYLPLLFQEQYDQLDEWKRCIVNRDEQRIVTQLCRTANGRRFWSPKVDVYYVADPPTFGVEPTKLGLPREPEDWEPVEQRRPVPRGAEGLRQVMDKMGDQGVVAVYVTYSAALISEEDIYRWYDNPDRHEEWAQQRVEQAESRFHQLMSFDVKPDVISVGGSGTLVYQTVDIFRKLAFPAVKRVIDLATAAGLPTHIHSCGPERELVKTMAEETSLTIIDPLESPPMGDCDLAEIKRHWGDQIVLKGNLHTTNVMLRGSVEDVIEHSKRAIDVAAEGGGFVLSTGDQCGRDTPEENIRAVVEAARMYGRYC
jgi:uroporphyrinogen decarboxylase